MVDITKDNLEQALNSQEKSSNVEIDSKKPQLPKELEIGFHEGTLNTLLNERNELIKIVKQVESLMQAHIKKLEELGVNVKVNRQDTSKN